MTDRELLELAAEAAGIRWDKSAVYDYPTGLLRLDGAGWWNPLEDDGDALRLYTKLPHRTLYVSEVGVTVSWKRDDGSGHGFKCDEYADENNGDLTAATRRAIVRAAAAIGAEMTERSQQEGR